MAWACASLAFADPPLLDAIAAASITSISSLSAATLPGLLDLVAAFGGLAQVSCCSLGFTGTASVRLLVAARAKLEAAGAEIDRRLAEDGERRMVEKKGARDQEVQEEEAEDEPSLLLRLPGLVLLMKPSGWAVDGELLPCAEGQRPLSTFLKTRVQCPLAHLSACDFGFLHRLDAPSSGLILCGTSFRGLFALAWQVSRPSLQSDYVVHCHGLLPAVLERIGSSMTDLASTIRGSESACAGALTSTFLTLIVHARAMVSSSIGQRVWTRHCVSVIAVRAVGDRRVRKHLRWIAHPAVADRSHAASSVTLCHSEVSDGGHDGAT